MGYLPWWLFALILFFAVFLHLCALHPPPVPPPFLSKHGQDTQTHRWTYSHTDRVFLFLLKNPFVAAHFFFIRFAPICQTSELPIPFPTDPSPLPFLTRLSRFSVILIRRRLRFRVGNVEECTVPCGIGDVLGNKGGVAIGMTVDDTRLCFILSHLAARADEGNPTKRPRTKPNRLLATHDTHDTR